MVDSVTTPSKWVSNAEMGFFGYLIAAVLVVLLVPVLPFLVVLWLYDQIRGAGEESGPGVQFESGRETTAVEASGGVGRVEAGDREAAETDDVVQTEGQAQADEDEPDDQDAAVD